MSPAYTQQLCVSLAEERRGLQRCVRSIDIGRRVGAEMGGAREASSKHFFCNVGVGLVATATTLSAVRISSVRLIAIRRSLSGERAEFSVHHKKEPSGLSSIKSLCCNQPPQIHGFEKHPTSEGFPRRSEAKVNCVYASCEQRRASAERTRCWAPSSSSSVRTA